MCLYEVSLCGMIANESDCVSVERVYAYPNRCCSSFSRSSILTLLSVSVRTSSQATKSSESVSTYKEIRYVHMTWKKRWLTCVA